MKLFENKENKPLVKLFADTANIAEIESILKKGIVEGITTNPTLLSKEPKTEFKVHIKKIIALIRKYQILCSAPIHLSVEVFSRNPEEIIAQAYDFYDSFQYEHLSVKVQIGWDELEAIHRLAGEGFSVNCTCCMSVMQAELAAKAGARFVSIFYHRITQGGLETKYNDIRGKLLHGEKTKAFEEIDFDPAYVIQETRKRIQIYPDTEIIAGSLHNPLEVEYAKKSGAHICTVSPDVMRAMVYHFKSEEKIQEFFSDFCKWTEPENQEQIE